MKSSTQVILPFLALAGMLNDAQARCVGLNRRNCESTRGCTWAPPGLARGCVPTSRSAQATLFNIIPSDSDRHDYELLHKGRPDQEGYAVDINMDIDSTGHSDSGDDVSDEYDDDLYLYEDEDMGEDEDIETDFSSHQKTRLRGSASFLSAISVGDGSRRTCEELRSLGRDVCRANDCRWFCRGNRCWCETRDNV